METISYRVIKTKSEIDSHTDTIMPQCKRVLESLQIGQIIEARKDCKKAWNFN